MVLSGRFGGELQVEQCRSRMSSHMLLRLIWLEEKIRLTSMWRFPSLHSNKTTILEIPCWFKLKQTSIA